MPDWADTTWRRQHLRAWAVKERQDRAHPSWAPARAQWAADKRFAEAIRAAASGALTDEQRQDISKYMDGIKEE
jgi:hypothetical protein